MNKEDLKYLFEEVEKQIDLSGDYFRRMGKLVKVFSEVEQRIENENIADIRDGLGKGRIDRTPLSDAVEILAEEFKNTYKFKQSYCQKIEECMIKAFEQKGIEPLSTAAINAIKVGSFMFINKFIEDVEKNKDENEWLHHLCYSTRGIEAEEELEDISNLANKATVDPRREGYTCYQNNLSEEDIVNLAK